MDHLLSAAIAGLMSLNVVSASTPDLANNPEAAKKGQQAATAAAIGFVIVFAAYWIVRLIEVIINVNIIS